MDSLLPADQALFEHFGQGVIEAVPHDCIHHAFEDQVAVQPQAIAAHHLGDAITYEELDRQASRLAAILARHGVSTGDNVALFIKRSIPMLVGLMAALKAGAAYVPQDVGVVPEAQLRHIIEVTSSRVILTLSKFKHLVPVPEGHVCIAIDELMAQPISDEDTGFESSAEVGRDDRCFILFTSGTTGNPNGVQVTHGNVCNILLTEPGGLGMRPGLKVGQILSISFDMSAWEILGCLSHGASLVIRGKDFAPVVESVDIIIATPTILGSFDAERCRQVKTVAVAGEPCPRPLADTWASFCRFYNSCGPTETTIINTAQHYRADNERLTIGKPTPNNTVYVLDENMQPCAIGEIGEMWAGGDCVTAGYLGNEPLTGERYAPDPFLGGGRMMFRTRDLGRWTPDGELEHFGRTDDQVKIRGFRVELDSVSGRLESVPACMKAVTLKYDSRDLVAFVSPAAVDVAAARAAVAEALPYYCTPALIIAMDAFPMTSRGKVDKRALMAIARERMANRDDDAQAPSADASSVEVEAVA
ncbi:MAG: amino acid adenylation domain-containing protein [Myxococcota bacterium]